MALNYVTGDATNPVGQGPKIICHVCNDEFRWGSGFVVALSKKWPQPEAEYKALKLTQTRAQLGTVQMVQIPNEDIFVANMIGQRGIKKMKDRDGEEHPPIRYPALFSCLEEVAKFAVANNASVHGPRFGSDRAGGDWRVIEALIRDILVRTYNLEVTIYDFPQPAAAAPASSGTDNNDGDDDGELL